MGLNFNLVEFIKSAASEKDFIFNEKPSFVFAGKSNVGKSSVINRLLNRKNFARVGDKPGKTIHVNYFLVENKAYLVDLPGYGFAKVSKVERDRWGKLMESYFSVPERISLGILIVDSRHKPTADDVTMAQWFHDTGRPLLVIANKCDKLKKSEMAPNLALIKETLGLSDNNTPLLFSAYKGDGRDELIRIINSYI